MTCISKLNVVDVSFKSVIINRIAGRIIRILSGRHVVFLDIKYALKLSLSNKGDKDFPGGNLYFTGYELRDSIISDDEFKIPAIKIGEKKTITTHIIILDNIINLFWIIKCDGIDVCFCGKDGSVKDEKKKFKYKLPIYTIPMIDSIAMIISLIALVISLIAMYPLLREIFQAIAFVLS